MPPGASLDAGDGVTNALGDGLVAMAPEPAISAEADAVADAVADAGADEQAEMANTKAAGTAIARIVACMQPPWHVHAAVKLRPFRTQFGMEARSRLR
jgi:hypothetical protein